ncbi:MULTISPECIES: N-acetyltransferase [unclassified Roseitalea]|uniref:GNAT family N-acetyltransferase n=1 Tax=unclassified Roseitalea TaxID=2639107 RepID=UPI00273D3C71|nr:MULTISPECIES: N-acetyltransferase [unclassified Roseitalea]
MTEFSIAPEQAHHHAAIEVLHEQAFGPGRFARAAFRLREQGPHEPALSFVALDADGRLLGSVRMTQVTTGARGQHGYLLGPLAVDVGHKNCGIGRALARKAVSAAAETRAGYVLLVGDLPYYGPLGFVLAPSAVRLPGPVDPRRLLVHPLGDAAPGALAGMVMHESRSATTPALASP